MIFDDNANANDPKAKALKHLANAFGMLLDGQGHRPPAGRRLLGGSGSSGGTPRRINVPGHPCYCNGQRRR